MIAPVLILAWIREEPIRSLLQVLQVVKPGRLYLSQDGPRLGISSDKEAIQKVNNLVSQSINWDCIYYSQVHEVNRGCGLGVSTGIDWFFEHEEEGIILEDDVIPDPSFFSFASSLLERYRHDTRIGAITGSNLAHNRIKPNISYIFTSYPYVFWGWATWKRAWYHYHLTTKLLGNNQLTNVLRDFNCRRGFVKRWQIEIETASKTGDTWDYLWMFTLWHQGMLVSVPSHSLIRNIGYGPLATHTLFGMSIQPECKPMTFPLTHPLTFTPFPEYDRFMLKYYFDVPITSRLIPSLNRHIRSIYKKCRSALRN